MPEPLGEHVSVCVSWQNSFMEVFCDVASVPTSQRGFWQSKNVCVRETEWKDFCLALWGICSWPFVCRSVWEPVCLCVCIYSLWWKMEVAGVFVDGVGWWCFVEAYKQTRSDPTICFWAPQISLTLLCVCVCCATASSAVGICGSNYSALGYRSFRLGFLFSLSPKTPSFSCFVGTHTLSHECLSLLFCL